MKYIFIVVAICLLLSMCGSREKPKDNNCDAVKASVYQLTGSTLDAERAYYKCRSM
jgi:uncharacterized protein YceK